jgi:nicotinate-nucleotide pyrophosphorylase (carboxylating)
LLLKKASAEDASMPEPSQAKQFHQVVWDDALEAEWMELLQLALREDLAQAGDLTTQALVPEGAIGRAAMVARKAGVVAGLAAIGPTLRRFDDRLCWAADTEDGHAVAARRRIGLIEGPARAILAAERLVLNFLGRLSGIATMTRRCVDSVAGTRARIYDTRKTIPGWRRLEKYAVRCGGGWNHRCGLFAAVLIKDNHLALGAELSPDGRQRYTAAAAVAQARRYLQGASAPGTREAIVEVEADTLEQLDEVLAAGPDLVLLDNMGLAELHEAVARRDALAPHVELEASGGIDLSTIRQIAETGIERISVGALTHSAVWLDIGLDWLARR